MKKPSEFCLILVIYTEHSWQEEPVLLFSFILTILIICYQCENFSFWFSNIGLPSTFKWTNTVVILYLLIRNCIILNVIDFAINKHNDSIHYLYLLQTALCFQLKNLIKNKLPCIIDTIFYFCYIQYKTVQMVLITYSLDS